MSSMLAERPNGAEGEPRLPQVPDQLEHYLSQGTVLSALTDGQDLGREDYLEKAQAYSRGVEIHGPDGNEHDFVAVKPGSASDGRSSGSGRADILFLPFGQKLSKESMKIRAELMHRVLGGEDDLVVVDGISNDRTAKEHGERNSRMLEGLGYDEYGLSGYSWGALSVLATIDAGSDRFNISRANADEFTFGEESIQKRFNDPAAYFKQLRAIKASEIRALRQALNPLRLGFDYAKFAKFVLTSSQAKSAVEAMEGTHDEILEGAGSQGIKIKLGATASHSVFETELFDERYGDNDNFVRVDYTGTSTEGHTLGDNVAAHALMVKQGFNLSQSE